MQRRRERVNGVLRRELPADIQELLQESIDSLSVALPPLERTLASLDAVLGQY
jgi:hypothetical protein